MAVGITSIPFSLSDSSSEGLGVQVTVTNGNASGGNALTFYVTQIYEGTKTYYYSEQVSALAAGASKDLTPLSLVNEASYDSTKMHVCIAFSS